jgi:hypothetical protein
MAMPRVWRHHLSLRRPLRQADRRRETQHRAHGSLPGARRLRGASGPFFIPVEGLVEPVAETAVRTGEGVDAIDLFGRRGSRRCQLSSARLTFVVRGMAMILLDQPAQVTWPGDLPWALPISIRVASSAICWAAATGR